MSITILGLAILPIGVVSIFNRKRLVYLTLASAPFVSTAIVNFETTSLRPYHYFGALLVVRQLMDYALGARRRAVGSSSIPGLLLFFYACILGSLFMPVLLEGTVEVVSFDTSYIEYGRTEPLEFSMRNLKQVFFPSFLVVLFFSVRAELLTVERLRTAVSVLRGAAIATALFGVVYQVLVYAGQYELLLKVFHTFTGSSDSAFYHGSELVNLFDATRNYGALGGIPRMLTPVGEPAFTSVFLAMGAALAAPTLVLVRRGAGRGVAAVSSSYGLIVAVILAGSTTGYLALVILGALTFALSRLRRAKVMGGGAMRTAIMGLCVILTLSVAVMAMQIIGNFRFSEYLLGEHVAKIVSGTGSGGMRMDTISYTLTEVVGNSPVLGVGWGSHRSGTTLTGLLASVGIVGTAAYLAFFCSSIFNGFYVGRTSRDNQLKQVSYELTVACAVVAGVTLVAYPALFLFPWQWCLVAAIDAAVRLNSMDSGIYSRQITAVR